MIDIKQKLCPPGLPNNPNRDLTAIGFITIHNTGNYAAGANALSHANYLFRGSDGRQASWHYTVDDGEVWQSFLDRQMCWHAGDGNGPGNTQSIGIEICVNNREKFHMCVNNAAKLTAMLLAKHNLTIDKVKQHYNWSQKDCPKELRSGIWGPTWDSFLKAAEDFGKGDDPKADIRRFQTIEEMPAWGQPTAQKLVDAGILKGTGKGLDISEDMLRILVMNDRAGVYR